MAAIAEHQSYNTLPSLDEANKSLQESRFGNVINGPVRDVFLRYGVEKMFCLYLLHRHHQVGDEESIVKVEGTAHLMTAEEMKEIISFGNKIVPTTWMISRGEAIAMEFASIPNGTEKASPSHQFIAELYSVLVSNECQGQFGVDTMAQSAWSELKIGNASVVVPRDHIGSESQENYIPVAFAFDEKSPTFIVHGKCSKNHEHTSKPAK